MIAKVFRAADTGDTGHVDLSMVPPLAAKVLGAGVKESDMQLIRYKAELKGSEGGKKGVGGEREVEIGGNRLYIRLFGEGVNSKLGKQYYACTYASLVNYPHARLCALSLSRSGLSLDLNSTGCGYLGS